jgi:hypothetical protein
VDGHQVERQQPVVAKSVKQLPGLFWCQHRPFVHLDRRRSPAVLPKPTNISELSVAIAEFTPLDPSRSPRSPPSPLPERADRVLRRHPLSGQWTFRLLGLALANTPNAAIAKNYSEELSPTILTRDIKSHNAQGTSPSQVRTLEQ